MKEEELLRWFQDDVLPTLIKNGNLSENEEIQSLEKCEFETYESGANNFASNPSFAKILLKTPSGHSSRNAFIKFQSQNAVVRERMKLTPQFQNEVTLYTKILPAFADFLKHCGQSENLLLEVVTKCYFANYSSEEPEKSIVILEDARKNGYRLSAAVADLDLEHCMISLERLAHFHAISFAMKLRNWKVFDQIKASIVKVWNVNDEITRNMMEDFIAHCSMRGIDYLMSQKNPEVPHNYLENLKRLLDPTGLVDLTISLSSPIEPLSVICHGDFNRNNILYKYKNGIPVDAKLIDFQIFKYSSPNIDLSYFIYMNTTLEFREKHFDQLYSHYYSSLIKRICLILGESEESIAQQLPLEAFRKDFARVAINGYIVVAFFLPIMTAPLHKNFEKVTQEKSYKELAEINYKQGGDVVSKRVAEVIVDFYRRKFYM